MGATMSTDLLLDNLVAHWLQAGSIATVAMLGVALFRVRVPRVRLILWQALLLLMIALPVIQPWQPITPPAMAVAEAHLPGVGLAPGLSAAPAPGADPWPWLLALIAGGVVVRLAWIAAGVFRLGRLVRRARRLRLPFAARAIEPCLGVRARYLRDTRVRPPFSFGGLVPTIVLPATFDTLEPAFQRAIVWHELLHVKRRDVIAGLIEELVVALLWFHPWVWLVRARIRLAREQVVDTEVVKRTGDRSAYVRCLLAMAGYDVIPQPSASMLNPSELRARVQALHQEGGMSRRRLTIVTAVLSLVLGTTVWVATSTLPLRAALTSEGAAVVLSTGQPSATRAIATGGDTRSPRRTRYVRPVYPEAARERALGGLLQLRVSIDATGRVARTEMLRSFPVFEEAARTAVRQWRYEPALRDGVPVPATVTVGMRFPESAQGTRYVELLIFPPGADRGMPFNVWDRQATSLLSWRPVGSLFFRPVIRDAAQGRVSISVDGEEGLSFGSVEVVAGGPPAYLDTLDGLDGLGIAVARILEQ